MQLSATHSNFITYCFGLIFVGMVFCGEAVAEERVALLIGNQHYNDNVGALTNPINDIGLIKTKLEQLRFEVTVVTDADFSSMQKAIKQHIENLTSKPDNTVDFIYYSGHGVANPDSGLNYLIPTDVARADKTLWANSVELEGDLINKLVSQTGDKIHYLVIDACRDELRLSAAASKAIVKHKGFSQITYSPTGKILVAFSTAPNQTASDVGEKGGPYARALADQLTVPGQESVQVFRETALIVQQTIGQVPYLSIGGLPKVYFASPPVPAATVVADEGMPAEAVAIEGRSFDNSAFQRSRELERAAIRDTFSQLQDYKIPFGAYFNKAARWDKAMLKVCFMDGTPTEQTQVARVARQWTLYGNIDFDFGDADRPRLCDAKTASDVRVSMHDDQPGESGWAFVGKDAQKLPANDPTVRLNLAALGSQEQQNGEILHEFGHVLGFLHTAQSPSFGCEKEMNWNQVYKEFSAFGWTRQMVDANMRGGKPKPDDVAGVFDRKSVMNFTVPEFFFKGGKMNRCFPTPTYHLSLGDKLAMYVEYGGMEGEKPATR